LRRFFIETLLYNVKGKAAAFPSPCLKARGVWWWNSE